MYNRLKREEKAIRDQLNNVIKYPSEYRDPEGYECKMLKRLSVTRLLMLSIWIILLSVPYALLSFVKLGKDIFRR